LSFSLAEAVEEWDLALAGDTDLSGSPDTEPFARLLQGLIDVGHLRFHSFQNDPVQDFVSKLQKWLAQMPASERSCAFELANRFVFITQQQFESLQRHLMEGPLRLALLDAITKKKSLGPLDLDLASRHLEEEITATLFVGNSSSSPVNSFSHVNSGRLHSRAARRLIGPDVALWTYPQSRVKQGLPPSVERLAIDFEREVIGSDPLIQGKRNLVVVEDFSGSGSDLLKAVRLLAAADLPFSRVIISPVMSTSSAVESLTAACQAASTASCAFEVVTAYRLPHRYRCFDTELGKKSPEPSYLDESPLQPGLSGRIKALSEYVYGAHLSQSLDPADRHGFGGLALAFAFHSNCPDNSLPMLWYQGKDWFPLFRRASNYL